MCNEQNILLLFR